jgi:hypothetical protein
MNKLFEMFDRYLDEKIIAKTNELEGLQIRDANRIADLERRLFGAVDMIEMQRGWIKELNDAKGLDFDVAEAEQKIEDFEYRISELECSIEDKADADATETTIDNTLSGIEDMVKDYVDTALVGADLGDIDSCEVERIVRCVLDEIEFKVTMER